MYQFITTLALTLILAFFNLEAGDSFNSKFKRLVAKEPPRWMIKQIDKDLAPYKESGITQDSLATLEEATKIWCTVRFTIKSNQVTYKGGERDCPFYQMHLKAVSNALNRLCSVVALPDVDFVIDVNDFGLYQDPLSRAPLLVFSKNKNIASQILIPDTDALNGYSDLEKTIESASKLSKWHKKKNIAFWRGATSGGKYNLENWRNFPRTKLVLLSLQHPELIDAKFHLFFQGAETNQEMLDVPGLLGASVSPQDSLEYKYLIDVDGYTCAWSRLYWALLSNSVVFKQLSNNIEWYYGILRPYKHYIPINEDCSDLPQKIKWAKENDRKVRQIAQQATIFAKRHLSEEMIYLYLYWVLMRYSELQRFIT